MGATVGARIEAATAASWSAAGCNTNLGIVLLCAPIAAAVERHGIDDLPAALEAVLAGLTIDDAAAAFRAIVRANPGGLGSAAAEDVHGRPTLGLRAAMALAAERDSIARQYADGFREVFEAVGSAGHRGFPLMADPGSGIADSSTTALVQQVYLYWLARFPDSHIVRKHGEGVAHIVMSTAQGWPAVERPGERADVAAWDAALKAARINPGTSADLTVATLLLAALRPRDGSSWHGS